MFFLENHNRYVIPRTELAYPCHQMKMHQNAAAAAVDLVMADFEDACPYEFKGQASRMTMVESLNTVDFGQKVIAIRPNSTGSRFFLGDMEAVMQGAPDRFHGIVLPKTDGPEDIIYLSRLLDTLEEQAGWTMRVQIEAIIETPLGLVNAHRIATASDRMAGLIFGIGDFGAALGVREIVEDQNKSFHYAKQAIVVAAKAAGLHAIDSVYLRLIRRDTSEEEARRIEEGLRHKNVEAANLGMDGSLIIHPQQAEIVSACYTPSDEQIAKAKRAIETYHELGGGPFVNPETGEFEDEATIKCKLRDLAKAVQAGKVSAEYLAAHAEKSKALTGGRKKAGGVRAADSPE